MTAVTITKLICGTIIILAVIFAILVLAARTHDKEDKHDGESK